MCLGPFRKLPVSLVTDGRCVLAPSGRFPLRRPSRRFARVNERGLLDRSAPRPLQGGAGPLTWLERVSSVIKSSMDVLRVATTVSQSNSEC